MARLSTFEPCYWVVKESLLEEKKAGRVFRIDVANMGYREGISFDAFFRPEKKRNWKGKERLYTYCPEFEHELFDRKGFMKDYWPKEKITVKNVAELFKLIGYDRITQKYVS